MASTRPITTKDLAEEGQLTAFVSRAQVRDLTGLSATTIWREIRAGRFPEPVTLSPNRKAFRASDIDAWVRGRTAKPLLKTQGR